MGTTATATMNWVINKEIPTGLMNFLAREGVCAQRIRVNHITDQEQCLTSERKPDHAAIWRSKSRFFIW